MWFGTLRKRFGTGWKPVRTGQFSGPMFWPNLPAKISGQISLFGLNRVQGSAMTSLRPRPQEDLDSVSISKLPPDYLNSPAKEKQKKRKKQKKETLKDVSIPRCGSERFGAGSEPIRTSVCHPKMWFGMVGMVGMVRSWFGTGSEPVRTGQFSEPANSPGHKSLLNIQNKKTERFGRVRNDSERNKCQHMSNIPTLVRKGQLFFWFCFLFFVLFVSEGFKCLASGHVLRNASEQFGTGSECLASKHLFRSRFEPANFSDQAW